MKGLMRNLFGTKQKRASMRSHGRHPNHRANRLGPSLEILEDRVMFVVGATTILPEIPRGVGLDGVVAIDVSNRSTNSGIVADDSPMLCSGALLSTGRHILTAAHCVDDNRDGISDYNSVRVVFQLPEGTRVIDVPRQDSTGRLLHHIHPEYKRGGAADLAILELPQVAPSSADRYPIWRGEANDIGINFEFVGYGFSGTGWFGQLNGTKGVRRLGANTFSSNGVFPDGTHFRSDDPDRVLLADFDGGGIFSGIFNTLGDASSLGTDEALATHGDSGGPAFLRDANGNRLIAGVIASLVPLDGVEADFGDLNVFMRVSESVFADWIDSVANTPPQIDPEYLLPQALVAQTGRFIGQGFVPKGQPREEGVDTYFQAHPPESLPIIATFRDDDPTTAEDYVVTIEWGDGSGLSRTDGSGPSGAWVFANNAGGFDIRSDHRYMIAGDYIATISVTDELANTAQSTAMITVADEPIPVPPPPPVAGPVFVHPEDLVSIGRIRIEPGLPLISREVLFSYLANQRIAFNQFNPGARLALANLSPLSGWVGFRTVLVADSPGMAQTFSLTPQFDSEKRYLGSHLTILDDQLLEDRGIADDQITLAVTSAGGVEINLNGEITQFDPGDILGITLNLRSGANRVNVMATPEAVPVTINAGAATDTIHVGAFTGLLRDVHSLTINGPTALILDDSNNADGERVDNWGNPYSFQTRPTYTITSSQVVRSDAVTSQWEGLPSSTQIHVGTIAYNNLANLALNAGQTTDTLHVQSTAAGTPVTIAAGAGNDIVNVGNTANTWDDLRSPLNVVGGDQSDTLQINDQGTTTGQTYNVKADSVTRTGVAAVSYTGIEQVAVNAGPRADLLIVESTHAGASVAVNAGGGGDNFNVGGSIQNLDTIQGPLTLDGQEPRRAVVNLSDIRTNTGRSYAIAASSTDADVTTTLTRSNAALITFKGVGSIGLYAGNANDTFTILSEPTSFPVFLNGGAGNDTLTARNAPNTWDVWANGGEVNTIYFGAMENLIGGSDADTFNLRTTAAVAGVLDGGAGNDTLNYSAYTSRVRVDLAEGTATGLARVSRLENVVGGSGNDTLRGNAVNNLLMGGAGTDTLEGRGGRDLLIGGLGVDTLLGGAEEDILIGGRTTYDANQQALLVILSEWERLDLTYDQRITNLRSGGGRNGSVVLGASQILNDLAADRLTGGAALDWFFAELGDRLDRANGEQRN